MSAQAGDLNTLTLRFDCHIPQLPSSTVTGTMPVVSGDVGVPSVSGNVAAPSADVSGGEQELTSMIFIHCGRCCIFVCRGSLLLRAPTYGDIVNVICVAFFSKTASYSACVRSVCETWHMIPRFHYGDIRLSFCNTWCDFFSRVTPKMIVVYFST